MMIVKNGNFMLEECIFFIFNTLVRFKVSILTLLGLILGCGEMFATSEALKKHYSDTHEKGKESNIEGRGDICGEKRKFSDDRDDGDVVTPIIEPMPAHIARRNRAVYDGPSRSLSIGQGQGSRKRRKV